MLHLQRVLCCLLDTRLKTAGDNPRTLKSFAIKHQRSRFWHTATTMTARATLPDLDALNPNELKALIFSQHEQLLSKDEQLLSRDNEIEHLK